jgi:hypothetical protein
MPCDQEFAKTTGTLFNYFCMQAVATCRCQRAAPTLTTIFEIAALAAPLIRTSADSTTQTPAAAADTSNVASPSSSSTSSRQRQPHVHVPQPVGQVGHASAAPVKLLLLLSLRLARGWAPAVVLAQGVRLVGSVVQQRENKDEVKAGREGTEGALNCCCWCGAVAGSCACSALGCAAVAVAAAACHSGLRGCSSSAVAASNLQRSCRAISSGQPATAVLQHAPAANVAAAGCAFLYTSHDSTHVAAAASVAACLAFLYASVRSACAAARPAYTNSATVAAACTVLHPSHS